MRKVVISCELEDGKPIGQVVDSLEQAGAINPSIVAWDGMTAKDVSDVDELLVKGIAHLHTTERAQLTGKTDVTA